MTSKKTDAVWLGNPETGIPIPVEQINPVMKMSKFAWLPCRSPSVEASLARMFEPTSLAMGTSKTLAIVWLMKVDIT